jgi:hypothetical protein
LNPALTAFADAAAVLKTTHGRVWTFGAVTATGWTSDLLPSVRKMLGAPDRSFAIFFLASDLSSSRPKSGDSWTGDDALTYRIIRSDPEPATGFIRYLVAIP